MLTPCYNRNYMSNEQADAIYGKLCREVRELHRQMTLYEVELKKIGKDLEITGRYIAELNFSLDRSIMERQIGSLWDLIEKYKQISIEYAEKTAQKEQIENNA
jgi:hypothetical protein